MDLRDRSVTRVLYLFHEYEPLETQMFINLLKPGMTVIDIGANTGYYTLIAALSVGETGRIVAFEPYPGNVEILSRNVELNRLDNVTIEAYAISDLDGVVKLYLSNINAGDHRIYDGKDDELFNVGRSRQMINVFATTLDSYINSKGIEVDLIKMDVQGAEYVALQGMKETLKVNQDIILMTEYWPHGLERCGTEPIEFLHELNALGFKIFLINSDGHFIKRKLKEVNDSVSGADHITMFLARDVLF
jgi:FkbM family methyltransferase